MLRHILLGIGATLIIISFGLMAGVNLPIISQPEPLTQATIIERAEKLGMIFPVSEKIALEPEIELAVPKRPITADNKQQSGNDLKPQLKIKNKNNDQSRKKKIIELTIQDGMKGWEAANLLVKKGLLENQKMLIDLLQEFNMEENIMAGTYKFKSGVSKLEVLMTITSD